MPQFLSDVNMTGGKITTVANPVLGADAMNKQTADANYAAVNHTHPPSSTSEVEVSTTQPTDPAVELWINPSAQGGVTPAEYLPLTGGTIAGNMAVTGDTIATWVSASMGADMGGSAVTNVADPIEAGDAATRQWVEQRSAPIIVLGATDPVPPGTLSGTVIVRTA